MKITILAIFASTVILSASGETPKSMRIPCTTWFPGYFHMADAIVVGEITEVTKAPSRVDPKSEVCRFSISVAEIGGDCPELQGITEVHSESPHAVKKGNWVAMLIHYYENKPNLATGSGALIVLGGIDEPLAKLFASKGTDFLNYSDEEMRIIKSWSPEVYADLRVRRQWVRDQIRKSEQAEALKP